jgi:hypothetical protein
MGSGVTSPGPTLGSGPLAPAPSIPTPGTGSYLKGWWHNGSLFGSWVTGMGNGNIAFDASSVEAQMMQNAPGVQNAIANFWWINTGVIDWTERTRERYQANFGAAGAAAAQFNPTRQFLGSYTVFVFASGPNAVQVMIWNQTSLRSFLADWSAIEYYDRGTLPTPGGNIYQTISFILPYP